MTNRSLLIYILFSFLLSACGQQGPLFMPIENSPADNKSAEDSLKESTQIENNPQETEAH
ncbi:MAG: lipoprotein [Methyloprofundus sp.]|nr:lipoprotein [Methyloprofundus sp.]